MSTIFNGETTIANIPSSLNNVTKTYLNSMNFASKGYVTNTLIPITASISSLLAGDASNLQATTAEATRAQANESVIANNLNSCVSSVQTVASNSTAESAREMIRAESAEGTLTTNVRTNATNLGIETARAIAAETLISTNVATLSRSTVALDEVTRATAAELVLTNNLNAEIARAVQKENIVSVACNNQTISVVAYAEARSMAAESVLTANLTSLTAQVTGNTSAITNLQSNGGTATNSASIVVLNREFAVVNQQIANYGLDVSTQGPQSIAFGTGAGLNGSRMSNQQAMNTAIGYDCLSSLNPNSSNGFSSSYNTGLGALALGFTTTGNFNTAVGTHAGVANTTGSGLTVVGSFAMGSNTTGCDNTAIGKYSMQLNTSGQHNTSVGSATLQQNISGTENTAVGYQSLQNATASNNTGVGAWTLTSDSSGGDNTAIGFSSGTSNTTGNQNTSVGSSSLVGNQAGSCNVAVGFQALQNSQGNFNVAVGLSSQQHQRGFSNTSVGGNSLMNAGNSAFNTAFGWNSLNNTVSALNADGLYDNGSWNTACGGDSGGTNVSGNGNTYLGQGADCNGASYSNSTALGSNALVTGSDKIQLGNNSIGTLSCRVALTVTSDKRLKTNIVPLVAGLAFINALEPVMYTDDIEAIAALNPKAPRRPDQEAISALIVKSGFLAQDVEAVCNAQNYDFDGVYIPRSDHVADHYGLKYASFVVPLVKAVQELTAMLTSALLRIELLEKK